MTLYFLWSRIALVYGWTFTSSSRKKDKKYCHRQARQRCVVEFTSKQSIDHEELLLATVGKNRTFLNEWSNPSKMSFLYRYRHINVCNRRTTQKTNFRSSFIFHHYHYNDLEKRMSPRI